MARGLDLNGDGWIGRPGYGQPARGRFAPALHVQVDEVTSEGHVRVSKLFDLPAAQSQLEELAEGLLRQHRPFTFREWTGKGKTFSDDQFEALRGQVEESHAGTINAGRPMILEGGLDWKPMSLTPHDMDFIAGKHAAAREIALAFGVPPMLLGLPGDNTYANYREANRALWRQAILPLAGGILSGLAQGLAGWFERASLSVDINRITALAEERQMLWAMAASADFLDSAEKRQMVGLA
jgi:HK97 family phage portal protein